MSENELTLASKHAIQAYMLKFVVPTGALLAILSGVSGYVLSGVARIDASEEAAKVSFLAAQSAAEAKADAQTAREDARKASEEATSLLEKAKTAAENAESTSRRLLTARDQVDKILVGQYDGLAKSLFEIRGFRQALATVPQKEIGEFKSRIEKIEASIYKGSVESVAAARGMCPDGTYAVGITLKSVPGGRAGYVEDVGLICRGLRFAN